MQITTTPHAKTPSTSAINTFANNTTTKPAIAQMKADLADATFAGSLPAVINLNATHNISSIRIPITKFRIKSTILFRISIIFTIPDVKVADIQHSCPAVEHESPVTIVPHDPTETHVFGEMHIDIGGDVCGGAGNTEILELDSSDPPPPPVLEH